MPCPIKTAIVATVAFLVVIFQLDYNGWASSFVEAKDKTTLRRMLYYTAIAFLIFFHIELFTGGYVCRLLFARHKTMTMMSPEAAVMMSAETAMGA